MGKMEVRGYDTNINHRERLDGDFGEELYDGSHFGGANIRRKTGSDIKKMEDIKRKEKEVKRGEEETKRREEGMTRRGERG